MPGDPQISDGIQLALFSRQFTDAPTLVTPTNDTEPPRYAERALEPAFDLYVTSSLPRALQTAMLIQEHVGWVEMESEPRLTDNLAGEGDRALWDRVTAVADALLARPEVRILVSCHGSIMQILRLYLTGQPFAAFDIAVFPRTGSYCRVTHGPHGHVDHLWVAEDHLGRRDR